MNDHPLGNFATDPIFRLSDDNSLLGETASNCGKNPYSELKKRLRLASVAFYVGNGATTMIYSIHL